jgi:hypothetical protein
MLIETMILAILTGWILKGQIRNLSGISLRGVSLIFIAFLIRVIPGLFRIHFLSPYLALLNISAPYLFIISYLLILTVAALNLKYRSMIPVFIGTLMNFLVVVLNKGLMPVHSDRLIQAGFPVDQVIDGRLDTYHVLSDEGTKALFLGDVILIPRPYPFPAMLSIGDLLLCIGIYLFIVGRMTGMGTRIS